MNGDLIIAFLCLAAAVIIGVTGILIDRPEKPKARPATQHSRRGQRRAARAAERAEDDQTVAWLAALKRPLRRVPATAIARARVAGLLAVLPARRAEPPCPRYAEPRTSEWPTTPGPWDTDEARAELVPLPPMPVDLARLAGEYGDLFGRPVDMAARSTAPLTRSPDAICVFCGHQGLLKAHHGGDLVCLDDAACQARGERQLPAAELTVVDLVVVDPPPEHADEFRRRFDGNGYMLPAPPNARAGYWQPRAELPAGPPHFLDWDPAVDDAGLIHLRYPWADQVVADFDWAPVSRG